MTTLTPEQHAFAQQILSGEAPSAPRHADPSHTEPQLDVHALIAVARESMGIKPVEKPGQVEAADPAAISALIALADEHERQAKHHTAEREAVKEALKDMLLAAEAANPGEHVEQLTVHGAPVFSYKRVVSRALNQKVVKQMFPDIPENAELYTDTEIRRATFA